MGYMQKRRRVAGGYRDQQVKAMTASKALSKIFKDESYGIFMIAILASLLWHLFWLTTISIVSNPDNTRHVKFSKVSFLGPLLGKGAMEFQAMPKERSFLEKRYLRITGALPALPEDDLSPAAGKYEKENDLSRLRDEEMIALIDDALSGEKLEPSYDEE